MSTVVVARKGGFATIAADTMTVFGNLRMGATYKRSAEKILRFGDTYLGVVGYSAHRLVVQSLFSHPKVARDFGSTEGIFETLRQVHPILKQSYYLNPKLDPNDPYESSQISMLVASPRGIFGVLTLREVFEYERFWALGSGQEYALGAMHALYERSDSSEEIARAGIEAGCEFDDSSAQPCTVLTVALRPPSPARRRATPGRRGRKTPH